MNADLDGSGSSTHLQQPFGGNLVRPKAGQQVDRPTFAQTVFPPVLHRVRDLLCPPRPIGTANSASGMAVMVVATAQAISPGTQGPDLPAALTAIDIRRTVRSVPTYSSRIHPVPTRLRSTATGVSEAHESARAGCHTLPTRHIVGMPHGCLTSICTLYAVGLNH